MCGERELLLSMLEHLPAEYPVSEAIDFVLLLVAEAARGLHKNRENGSALFLYLVQNDSVLLAKQQIAIYGQPLSSKSRDVRESPRKLY